MNYFIDCMTKKYAKFDGRARRAEYWFFVLFSIIAQIVLGFLIGVIGGLIQLPLETIQLLANLVSLAFFLPGLAVCIRRLHDIGKSGWWVLIVLIPIIGAIILLIFEVQEGNRGPNQYGPDPKAGESY